MTQEQQEYPRCPHLCKVIGNEYACDCTGQCFNLAAIRSRPAPSQHIDTTKCFEDLVYSSAPWKIFRQDAGMGEHDYAVMLNDVFFCRTEYSQTAHEIIRAVRRSSDNQPHAAQAPPEPTEYYITHDINCEYSSTITVTSHEKPEKIDVQTVKVGGITICFDSEIESIETMEDIERRINNGVQ